VRPLLKDVAHRVENIVTPFYKSLAPTASVRNTSPKSRLASVEGKRFRAAALIQSRRRWACNRPTAGQSARPGAVGFEMRGEPGVGKE
jgi:hypothetical protein